MSLIAVVGMKREARIVGPRAIVTQRGLGVAEALRGGGTAVISFGLAGALDPSLRVGDLIIGEAVNDGIARFECATAWREAMAAGLPGARQGLFYADGGMIAGVEHKQALHASTGAVAVDMESHIAARAAAEHGVPFGILRVVSDTANTAIPALAQAAFAADGSVAIGALFRNLLASGAKDMRALVALARDAGHAFRSLESAASVAFSFSPAV